MYYNIIDLVYLGRRAMDKTELTAREKNEGRVRLLRLLQLLESDSDAEHPISTPDCIRLLKERWDICTPYANGLLNTFTRSFRRVYVFIVYFTVKYI